MQSHPVWVRGLKHDKRITGSSRSYVAPRVGAWIETLRAAYALDKLTRRTPCGCVD